MGKTKTTTPVNDDKNTFTEEGLAAMEGAPVLSGYQKQAEEMYAPYKPTSNEYEVAAPVKSDYQRGQEWYETYFPTISKDEEQRREAQVRNAARWQLFGNAAASIANAIGSWSGGAPVTMPEAKYPDLQAWKNQLNANRKARAVQEDADRKAYTTAYNTWMQGKLTNDKYNMKRLDEWQNQTAKYARALQEQDFKKAQQGDKEAYERWKTIYNNDRADKRKQMVGGGTLSHSGSGGKGNPIDSYTPTQVNTAFDNAVAQGVIKKDYKNSKDVGAKRAALKKAYGKSSTSNTTSDTSGSSGSGKSTTRRTTAVGNLRNKLKK